MSRVCGLLCRTASVALLFACFLTSTVAAQKASAHSSVEQRLKSAPIDFSETEAATKQKPLFTKFKRVPTMSYPEALVVADVDGNGYGDIVTAIQEYGDAKGLVTVNLGSFESFTNSAVYSSGGNWASSVAVADLNNDGKLDIVVTNYACSPCEQSTVGVLLGNGDGTFQPVVTYNVNAEQALGVVVGDLNNDGKPDLMVAAFYGISVLLGNGDGTFQSAVVTPFGIGFTSIVAGDVNGDHNLDVVASGQYGLAVFLGKGDGTFQTPVDYSSGAASGGWAQSVVLGDLNRDGSLDIAAANYPDGTVGVLLNKGDGTFAPAELFDTGASLSWSLAIGDVTGDLKPDLVVANQSGSFSVLTGNGDGTFQSPLVFVDAYGGDNSVAIYDINKDRTPDVVLSDGGGWASTFANHAPKSTTSTTLTSSPNPATIGQAVTFTATVSSAVGSPPDGEIVTFKSAGTVLGTAPLHAGTASITVVSLAKGHHYVNGRYPGDSDYLLPSKSPGLLQVITP